MFLTDCREQTLHNVITQFETSLFTKVTGLALKDFELLISLVVFNGSAMNQAIFAFKCYEGASLSYTGLNKHEDEKYGWFDAVLSQNEVEELLRD